MDSNRTFQIAVLFSILVHSIFFLNLPYLQFLPSKKSLEKLKITYYIVKQEPERKKIAAKKTQPILKDLPEIKKEELIKRPLKAISKKIKNKDPQPKHIKPLEDVKKKSFEVVVREEQNDARKATYISYYRAVRERIRLCADRNYPRNRNLDEGEVFLSFVVASSGELLEVKVINGRSIDRALLRNIAINSIRDANPFPAFPRGMDQYQVTFNIAISFELNR